MAINRIKNRCDFIQNHYLCGFIYTIYVFLEMVDRYAELEVFNFQANTVIGIGRKFRKWTTGAYNFQSLVNKSVDARCLAGPLIHLMHQTHRVFGLGSKYPVSMFGRSFIFSIGMCVCVYVCDFGLFFPLYSSSVRRESDRQRERQRQKSHFTTKYALELSRRMRSQVRQKK